MRGHVKVTANKSKPRKRRLVGICAGLKEWLALFRTFTTGPIWPDGECVFQKACRDLCGRGRVGRKANGLRRSFCSFEFALHANENLTAQQAGDS